VSLTATAVVAYATSNEAMSYNFCSLFNEFHAKALRFAKTQSVLATFVFSLGGSACNFLFTSKKIPLLKYGGIVTKVDIPGCGSQVMHLCTRVKICFVPITHYLLTI